MLILPNGDVYKSESSGEKRPNRLKEETSPYLLQHAYNPVDWYPWGPEAVEKARSEGKPMLISIGYSACHWCHVMERESFEDPELARLINETVVAVKVDREERPDVDAIYMEACMAMNGHGGWPLNAFVTPELRPFFVGTYFPPKARGRMPGFGDVLKRIAEIWRTDRLGLVTQARMLHEGFLRSRESSEAQSVDGSILDKFVADHERVFDSRLGGFGQAPKFPPDTRCSVLLAAGWKNGSSQATTMAMRTLEAMARGGIYDHVGGGFARYSVDAEWLIPHFEKMLYNQALLVPVYGEAWLQSKRDLWKRTALETLDWCERDLLGSDGAYQCALDADSEGEEGKYYVWTPQEIREILGAGPESELFCRAYGIVDGGNFEHGTSNPNAIMDEEELAKAEGGDPASWREKLDQLRLRLREARQERVSPGLDDKCLAAWNGLMVTALARAWQIFGRQKDLDRAIAAASFFTSAPMWDNQAKRLKRVWCKGKASVEAVLEDYAYLLVGFLDLYECRFEQRWLDLAQSFADVILEEFEDRDSGGYFSVRAGDDLLVTRPRDEQDGALPAASSLAALGLARLGRLLERARYLESARRALESKGQELNKYPAAFASLLQVREYLSEHTPEIIIHGGGADEGAKELLKVVYGTYLPARILVRADRLSSERSPLVAGRETADQATAFVCFLNTCQKPVHTPSDLQGILGGLKG
jgi:uncharacterized protein YyaL (SSP411 family)